MPFRAFELHDGDELFCSTNTFEIKLSLGMYIKFNKGFEVAMRPIENEAYAIVTKIIKSHPEKRWWQFWIKREIIGYILRIVENKED